MSINRVCISGNLTRDPELRATAGGTQVMSLGIAVNDRRKNPQTGEWEDCPNFVDCTVFGARAEKLAPYLSKGARVAIEGKLRYSSWERDGQKRSKLEVIADEIEFLSRDGSQTRQGGPETAYGQSGAGAAYSAPGNAVQAPAAVQAQINRTFAAAGPQAAPDVYDEEVPF